MQNAAMIFYISLQILHFFIAEKDGSGRQQGLFTREQRRKKKDVTDRSVLIAGGRA